MKLLLRVLIADLLTPKPRHAPCSVCGWKSDLTRVSGVWVCAECKELA